jgi:hypothetical protein
VKHLIDYLNKLDAEKKYKEADIIYNRLIKFASENPNYDDPLWYKNLIKPKPEVSEQQDEIDEKTKKEIKKFITSEPFGGMAQQTFERLCQDFGLTVEFSRKNHLIITHPALKNTELFPYGKIVANCHEHSKSGKMAFGAYRDLQKALKVIYPNWRAF